MKKQLIIQTGERGSNLYGDALCLTAIKKFQVKTMSVVTKFFLSLRQRIEHYYDIRRLEFRIGSTSVVVAFYFILFYSFLEREERGSCIYSSDNNQFCPIWSVSYSSSSPSLCYSSILCLGIRIVK